MKHKELETILALPSRQAAPLLLGCTLTRKVPEGEIALKIVETESYHQEDPASHSYAGRTRRTEPMFKAGGHIYIYFIYGIHYCINIVTGREGVGEAVLLRAGEPLAGIDIMKKNRGASDLRNIASGPGKFAQSLGIQSTSLSGTKLGNDFLLRLPDEPHNEPVQIAKRVGITKAADQPWRYYLKNNPYVSRP